MDSAQPLPSFSLLLVEDDNTARTIVTRISMSIRRRASTGFMMVLNSQPAKPACSRIPNIPITTASVIPAI